MAERYVDRGKDAGLKPRIVRSIGLVGAEEEIRAQLSSALFTLEESGYATELMMAGGERELRFEPPLPADKANKVIESLRRTVEALGTTASLFQINPKSGETNASGPSDLRTFKSSTKVAASA